MDYPLPLAAPHVFISSSVSRCRITATDQLQLPAAGIRMGSIIVGESGGKPQPQNQPKMADNLWNCSPVVSGSEYASLKPQGQFPNLHRCPNLKLDSLARAVPYQGRVLRFIEATSTLGLRPKYLQLGIPWIWYIFSKQLTEQIEEQTRELGNPKGFCAPLAIWYCGTYLTETEMTRM